MVLSHHFEASEYSHAQSWECLGLKTVQEELICRVLGDLLEEGIVVKLTDELYCGADTLELVFNFPRILAALNKCDLKLSASKNVIAPRKTTIRGWICQQGPLSARPHHRATAFCEMPTKVIAMRSLFGVITRNNWLLIIGGPT